MICSILFEHIFLGVKIGCLLINKDIHFITQYATGSFPWLLSMSHQASNTGEFR